jgi:hypothetical protein
MSSKFIRLTVALSIVIILYIFLYDQINRLIRQHFFDYFSAVLPIGCGVLLLIYPPGARNASSTRSEQKSVTSPRCAIFMILLGIVMLILMSI